MDERELEQAERDEAMLEWERADMEREAQREARLDEERAIVEAGGEVEQERDPFDFESEYEPSDVNTEDVPF